MVYSEVYDKIATSIIKITEFISGRCCSDCHRVLEVITKWYLGLWSSFVPRQNYEAKNRKWLTHCIEKKVTVGGYFPHETSERYLKVKEHSN